MQTKRLFPALLLTLLLAGCGASSVDYSGLTYPATPSTRVTFQEEGVPPQCMAFAHLLMTTKMRSTGKDMAEAMEKEAAEKGADLVLVGLARELPEEQAEENHFAYYGPEYAYSFRKTWLGWKFGFSDWDEAGSLVGLGIDTWGNDSITYDNSLMIQAVFLRCDQP